MKVNKENGEVLAIRVTEKFYGYRKEFYWQSLVVSY